MGILSQQQAQPHKHCMALQLEVANNAIEGGKVSKWQTKFLLRFSLLGIVLSKTRHFSALQNCILGSCGPLVLLNQHSWKQYFCQLIDKEILLSEMLNLQHGGTW